MKKISSLAGDALGQSPNAFSANDRPSLCSLSRALKYSKVLYTYFESTSVNNQNFMPNLLGLFRM